MSGNDPRDTRNGSGVGQGQDGRRPNEDADTTVRRLYQEILGRAPDAQGLSLYRGRMLNEGWSELAVRDALLKSPEYLQKNTQPGNAMTPQRAQEIVARAYRSVLGREPDAGSSGYVQKVLREGWTEADLVRDLRNSPEYRNKHQ